MTLLKERMIEILERTEINNYLERRKAHFCDEWDGLFIDKDSPEFECCLCFKE